MSSSAPRNLRLTLRKMLDFNGDDREPFSRYPLPFQHLICPHPPAPPPPGRPITEAKYRTHLATFDQTSRHEGEAES